MSQAYWFIFFVKGSSSNQCEFDEFKTMVIAMLCMRQRNALQVPSQCFASANAMLCKCQCNTIA